MFSKNLELYRKANGYSQRALAQYLNISHTTISKFEKGDLFPNGEILVKIAKILNVKTYDLMKKYNDNFEIKIPYFRKKKISEVKLEYLLKKIRLEIQDFLYLDNLDKREKEIFNYTQYSWHNSSDYEASVKFVKKQLSLHFEEPVYDLTYHLENNGFVILQSKYPNYFDGAITYVEGYNNPFIIINDLLPADRHRFTITHELGHHFINFDEVSYTEKEQEKSINMFSSAFLLPDNDMKAIFGKKRTRISLAELGIVKKKYKTSLQSIVMRIHDLDIISKDYKSDLFKYFSFRKIRTNEPYSFSKEEPTKKISLVYYLYLSDILSLNRAAESLHIPVEEIQESSILT